MTLDFAPPRFVRAADVAGRLGDVDVATLFIHGGTYPLVPRPNWILLAEQIPGAGLIVYEGVGHIPEVEVDDCFNTDLIGFLS